MSLLLTTKLDRHHHHHSSNEIQTDRLSLTAEDRVRSRHPFVTESGREVYVQLKRGTQLQGGDRLQSEDQSLIVEIVARPEHVMAVTTAQVLDLLEAAYHLGNRHVPLEINETHLYLLPDPVLRDMLHQRGLTVVEVQRPFQPQAGAYESPSQHSHGDGSHHHHH
jgi:urease accessory protein